MRSIWHGSKVRLRAIEPGDWETYCAWNFDDEQTRNLDSIPFPRSREAMKRWAAQEATRQPEQDNFRFVIENTAGEVVGDLTTHDCDRRAGTFSYGISIRHDQRGQGYAAEAIALTLRYYFQELGYQKVTVHVYDFNEASVRLHERLGFQLEGHLRRMAYTNGTHHDILVYGLLREEFDSSLAESDPQKRHP